MGTIHKGYKFRLYPTQEQSTLINKTIGCCRFVFNQALGEHNHQNRYWSIVEELVQNGQISDNQWKSTFFSADRSQKELTSLKKERKWLSEVDSTALQGILQKLGKAFKSKKNEVQSYTSKCNYTKSGPTIRIENDCFIRLPKLGLIRFAKSKRVKGKILSATIRRTPSGKYFVSVLTEQERSSSQSSFFKVGIDVGLKDFATLSDGTKFKNPKWFRRTQQN